MFLLQALVTHTRYMSHRVYRMWLCRCYISQRHATATFSYVSYRLWFYPCYVFPLHVRDSPCARNAILLQRHVWLLVWKDLKTEESFRKYVFIIIIITLLKDNNMTKPYSTRRIRRLRCSKTSSKSMSCIICVSSTDFPEPSSVSVLFFHFKPDNDFAIANVYELEILAQSMMGK
jgi:hypothetical protein